MALAQETIPNLPNPSPAPVEYVLPFPGILPDHPLFIIKHFRDQLLFLLITHPVRRVEFAQLQADKYLQMGMYLFNQDKQSKSLKTLTQGAEYLKSVDNQLRKLTKTHEQEAANLNERLERSTRKHLEIIQDLESRTSDRELKKSFEMLLQEVKLLQENFSQSK